MTASVFSFAENVSLATNLAAFTAHLGQIDAELGACIGSYFHDLKDGSVEQAVVWDSLFEATDPNQAKQSPSAVNVPGNATANAANSNGVTGWLLEGISIEGFRGINNQGKPLELKFLPGKINSLSAVNGVGKSSIHDAIRYTISGKVQWLEDLPASEKGSSYYLNRFNTSGRAEIKLRLLAEPTGAKCEITVTRDAQGNRTVSASGGWDGEAVLAALDREFVLLDGPAFQNFIGAKPLERGRTFSGLLGLSAYSLITQALGGLCNTRAFSNHFETTLRAQTRAREEKNVTDGNVTAGKDYAVLVGADLVAGMLMTDAMLSCQKALAQIGPLKASCDGKTFMEIDVEACLEAVKLAEGGPKRDELAKCIAERAALSEQGANAPKDDRIKKLGELAADRQDALDKTSGDTMLELFLLGAKVLAQPEWPDPKQCPLCESGTPHDLRAHVAQKLAEFELLDVAMKALALEWEEGGWSDLLPFEKLLEPDPTKRLGVRHEAEGLAGTLSRGDAQALIAWHGVLRDRAANREKDLAAQQKQLEKELPQSLVEVTKKIEAARRLQQCWKALEEAEKAVKTEVALADRQERLKRFLDQMSDVFSVAESALSKARLAAVEPIFRDYFKRMAFFGVVPAVSKKATGQELQISLADFYGHTGLSPQAVLSESYRNAFAVSLYLAAASLYGGAPKFIILDDVTSSFDAGHQNFLVELLRTTFARPGNPAGPQVILLSHDTMLERLFNKHTNSGGWFHQRLEGNPQFAVLPQAGAVNKVRDYTISQLQAGQADTAKEGVRQYLEYRLSDLISRLRIPVPADVAFSDTKQLAGDFLNAIDAAIKLHSAANMLSLEPTQVAALNANMVTIVGNFLSHWGTGQTLSFSAPALMGVMQAIDDYCECFRFEPTPGSPRIYYKSLSQRI